MTNSGMPARPQADGDQFDVIATRYDAWFNTPIGRWADQHETAAILRLLSTRPGERVLDLGAGTGRLVEVIAELGAKVVGIDASQAMLAVAQWRAASSPVTLVQADMTRLPFAPESFDAVVAVTSLCFASDPHRVLAEAARVLRPGGRLVIGELNRWSLWALVRRTEDWFRPTTYRSAHFRSLGELRGLLLASGLHTVRWEGMLHVPPIDNAPYLRLLAPIDRLVRRCCPAFGAFLAIEARKPGSGNSES